MNRLTRFGIPILSACLVIGGGVSAAQTRPGQQGPLVLQPTNDGPFVAPEVKFGDFDGQYGTLVGGYGGWLADNRLLIGAGATFLVDHSHHDPVANMGYGGAIVGYTVPATKGLNAGFRALVGWGYADLTDSYTYTVGDYPVYPNPHHGPYYPPGTTITQQVYFNEGFFIFEPQASAVVHVARGFAVDLAAGYRVISGAGHYNRWLQGPSFSVGIRFGPRI